MCSHRNAVDKLHGTPQSVKLNTVIHVHDPIAGQRPAPDGVIQKGPDPSQDDFKHGQATAETLLCQQVPLSCYRNLLQKGQNVIGMAGSQNAEVEVLQYCFWLTGNYHSLQKKVFKNKHQQNKSAITYMSYQTK